MIFEFDAEKSKVNADKHGIDFVEAQQLWEDENMLMLPAPHDDERRQLCIGRIDEVFWTAIVVERQGNIRIISVRRAREKEKKAYDYSS